MPFIKNISPTGQSDADLILLYKQSADLKVLGELYQRHMDLVYGICLKYLKDIENAKDSTLSIFEELITKLKKHEVENFKAWLYQLTKNHCLMQLRSRKRFLKTDIDPAFMQNEETVHLYDEPGKDENFQQLEYCLEQLSKEQKITVELFYLQSKCYKEIAEITGIDWNRVRSYIQNGRRNLKLCMDKQKLQAQTNA